MLSNTEISSEMSSLLKKVAKTFKIEKEDLELLHEMFNRTTDSLISIRNYNKIADDEFNSSLGIF